jgi:TPR repeat protein
MRSFSLLCIAVLCAIASAGQANDALRCLDLVSAEQFEAARPVCRNLELNDPDAAMAFAYYQLCGEVGRKRLPKIATLGIDKASEEERRALESARRHFQDAAEAGNPDSQMLLSMTIGIFDPPEISADGVAYNQEQARWLMKAAEQGVPEANYQLGTRALSLGGTLLIQPEFLPYLKRAAMLGHEEGAKLLSKYETARQLAATDSLDDPDALRSHATELLRSPEGSAIEGIRLMRLLADAGDVEAMFLAGRWAWPADSDGAKKYLTMAVDSGWECRFL